MTAGFKCFFIVFIFTLGLQSQATQFQEGDYALGHIEQVKILDVYESCPPDTGFRCIGNWKIAKVEFFWNGCLDRARNLTLKPVEKENGKVLIVASGAVIKNKDSLSARCVKRPSEVKDIVLQGWPKKEDVTITLAYPLP